jgi:protein involved in polysaccharide export with SLBB domain
MNKKLFHYKQIVIAFLIISLCFFSTIKVSAQSGLMQTRNLNMLKIDQLNDDQITQFSNELNKTGLSWTEAEKELRNRNLPEDEIRKLKVRIENLAGQTSKKNNIQKESTRTINNSIEPIEHVLNSFRSPIFGADLFSNKNLSFEPNLKIATPLNYQLGPDDELIIDLTGYSEETYQLKVTPEGNIRIPIYGTLSVSGATIEQAKLRISSLISKQNPTISTGETKIGVSLGNIRSIKVVILGEVNLPGTYTLPSLATVFNALYASGGPNENGSFRNIKVIRANKLIATLDVYDYLMNGTSKANIRLQDQDVIKVSAYENRVEFRGYVKREGYFETNKTESLSDLLKYTGGFSGNAYRERIKVERNDGKQKSVADIPASLFGIFQARNGDVFYVDSILTRFSNRVEIKGAIFRPGYFALEDNPTVSKLISNAEGLREDAFKSRAIIYRLKEDNSQEMLSVDLEEVLSGKKADVPLKREDVIIIASKNEMKEQQQVVINGEVLRPGSYKYAEKMKLEDLIIAAGGLKENAAIQRIEVSRRIKDADRMSEGAAISMIKSFEVNQDLKDRSNFELEAFDIVTIFKAPGFLEQKKVILDGEVMYPGVYVLQKNDEKISDIIKRAGGLTINSFPEGAILIRAKDNSITGNVIKENKLNALRKQSKDTLQIDELIESESNRTTDIVGIDLQKIIKKPGSKFDLLLRDSDVVRIPIVRQTILVSGQVLYPVRLRHENGKSFRSYISQAGGFSSKALKRRSYIIYSNGTAKATKNFLFFKLYPKVKPGCELVVPVKEDKKGLSTIEVVTLTTSLTSMLVILSTFIKL